MIRTPHILISDEGNQIFTPKYIANFTPQPQDHGYGRFLITPWSQKVVNRADSDDASAWEAGSSSASEQESVATPLDDLQPGDVFMEDGEPIIDHGDSWQDELPSEKVEEEADFFEDHSSSHWAITCPTIFEDEEDDDLPPFDDWYQSIAERTQDVAQV